MGRRSKFDVEFRCQAVEMAGVSGRPRYQVAADLGISDTTLAKWMKQQNEDSGETPLTISEREELEMLRSEKREWIMEREILKSRRPSG
ncbi:MAG: transposase [Actinomycetia bacterium]|nr:transposase [Actinomycetes bacterium]